MEIKYKNNFMLQQGTNVIHVKELKRIFNHFSYGSAERIYLNLLYLSLRTNEPMEISWDNFFDDCTLLIFRPKKQNSTCRKVGLVRKLKIPGKMAEEFRFYRSQHYFENKRLFRFSSNSFRDRLNKKFRKEIGGEWERKSENIRTNKEQRLSKEWKFTLRSFRKTCATTIFYYFSKEYGQTDMNLIKTCKFMGHSHKFMTGSHYIDEIKNLGLERYANLEYFELIEAILYEDMQVKISNYQEENSNCRLEVFDNGLIA